VGGWEGGRVVGMGGGERDCMTLVRKAALGRWLWPMVARYHAEFAPPLLVLLLRVLQPSLPRGLAQRARFSFACKALG
jgi:hypothetical protein